MARPPKIPYDKIIQMKFGRLKPIKQVGIVNGRMTWLCKCDCGNELKVIQKALVNGNTKSCGCLQKEKASVCNKSHGKSKTRIYSLYDSIKQRCYNPNALNYQYYGGKGVEMCEEWRNNYLLFEKWLFDNGYDETLKRGLQTIDRIDSDGNYCPENCRLITIAQQQRNKKCLKKYSYNGESHLLCEWAEILGLNYKRLKARINVCGWSFEEAVTVPLHTKLKKHK